MSPTPDHLPIEKHPLKAFLPQSAKILMLGSFPPQKKRWCMDFFYPNWNNDMWRIWGLIAKGDKNYFIIPNNKKFDEEKIKDFCKEIGLALYDTAEEVIRLKNNASDNSLQIIKPTDLKMLLQEIPECHTIVSTGQKSAEVLQSITHTPSIPIGEYIRTNFAERPLTIWRMPSSSRAYPRPIEWKATYYRKILSSLNMT